MASLPQYMTGQNQFDTTPLENGLARYFQRQQWQQEQANKQRQLEFEAQRVGMDQQRLGFQAERQPYELAGLQLGNERARLENQGIPLQQNLTREQIAAAAQNRMQHERMNPLAYDAAVEANRQARVVNPIEAAAKYKALEADKRGTIKEGEQMWVADPTQPGGVRFIDPPAGANNKLNPTTQKEIAEADDFILQNQAALDAIKRARQLNTTAYDGFAAGQRAVTANNIPGFKSPRSMDTVELENVVTNQALQSLRSIFGGNPTEGERKILLAVAGSVDQPREVRDRIYAEAQRLAEIRLKVNTEKASALRSGTYYRPGGQPGTLASPAPATGPRASTAPAQPVAAPPQPLAPQQRPIPDEAIKHLQSNPTPDMIRFFDEKYGPGAAKRALRMQ